MPVSCVVSASCGSSRTPPGHLPQRDPPKDPHGLPKRTPILPQPYGAMGRPKSDRPYPWGSGSKSSLRLWFDLGRLIEPYPSGRFRHFSNVGQGPLPVTSRSPPGGAPVTSKSRILFGNARSGGPSDTCTRSPPRPPDLSARPPSRSPQDTSRSPPGQPLRRTSQAGAHLSGGGAPQLSI